MCVHLNIHMYKARRIRYFLPAARRSSLSRNYYQPISHQQPRFFIKLCWEINISEHTSAYAYGLKFAATQAWHAAAWALWVFISRLYILLYYYNLKCAGAYSIEHTTHARAPQCQTLSAVKTHIVVFQPGGCLYAAERIYLLYGALRAYIIYNMTLAYAYTCKIQDCSIVWAT